MSSVEKMSIFGGKEKEKSSISNNGKLSYIEDATDGLGPSLYIGTYDIVIESEDEFALDGYRKSGVLYCSRHSRLGFSNVFHLYHHITDDNKKDIQDYSDIMILGVFCELLCHLRVPINILTENEKLVNEYVRKVFEYLNESPDYQFDLSRAMSLLSGNVDCDFDMDATIRGFVLPGKLDNNIKYFKSLLIVNRSKIVLRDGDSEEYVVNIPENVASLNSKVYNLNTLYDAIVWYLLVKNGYHCVFDYDNSYFYNGKVATNYSLDLGVPSQRFEFTTVFSTSNGIHHIPCYF